MHPAGGSISRTARVSTARWNLKEAEGKTLARRTGITYEAYIPDKKANMNEEDADSMTEMSDSHPEGTARNAGEHGRSASSVTADREPTDPKNQKHLKLSTAS